MTLNWSTFPFPRFDTLKKLSIRVFFVFQILPNKTALTSTFCGTTEYMAPEIVFGSRYGVEVDWWCVGVLLYELTVKRLPFIGSKDLFLYWLLSAIRWIRYRNAQCYNDRASYLSIQCGQISSKIHFRVITKEQPETPGVWFCINQAPYLLQVSKQES